MSTLTALIVATPLFGLSLQPPTVAPMLQLQVDAAVDAEAAADSEQAEEDAYEKQLGARNDLAGIHRTLGITTWGAMTVAVVLGTIQYYNLYGFFADQSSNPCVEGSAIFGQGQCTGTPLPHALSAGVATALYAGTYTMALLMPDPDNLAEGKGEFASTLRLHKLLRWVHLVGMFAQGILGAIIANSSWVGLDRANDYGTLQALATVHWGIGLVTYGALTWAGTIMTF